MRTADRIRRLGLAAAAVVACALAAPAARASGPAPLDGVYTATGSDGAGGEYEGAVHIMSHGGGVRVTWFFARQEGETRVLAPSAVGVGIVSDGMLAVSYYGVWISGVALYRIEDAGERLVGRWTVAGSDGTEYPETLTRVTTLPQPSAPRPGPVGPARPARQTGGHPGAVLAGGVVRAQEGAPPAGSHNH